MRKRELRLVKLTQEQEEDARRKYPDRRAVEQMIKKLYQECCKTQDHYRDLKFHLGRLLVVIQAIIAVRSDRDFIDYVENTLKIPKSSAYEYRTFYLRVVAEGDDYASDPDRDWDIFETSGPGDFTVEDVQATEAALSRKLSDGQREQVTRKIEQEVAKVRARVTAAKEKTTDNGSAAIYRPRLEFRRSADSEKFHRLWNEVADKRAAADALLLALKNEVARQKKLPTKKNVTSISVRARGAKTA